jgi:hypothetical protein
MTTTATNPLLLINQQTQKIHRQFQLRQIRTRITLSSIVFWGEQVHKNLDGITSIAPVYVDRQKNSPKSVGN